MRVRYHHSASNFEETTHVPIILSLPGKLPEDMAVAAPVRTIDIAPTILDLEGLEPAPKMTGRTLVPRPTTEPEAEPRDRPLGRARDARAARRQLPPPHARGEGGDPDLRQQGGERPRGALRPVDRPRRAEEPRARPARKAAEMRARLDSRCTRLRPARPRPPPPSKDDTIAVSLRFVGAGAAHRVSGSVSVDPGVTLAARPVNLGPDAVHGTSPRIELSFSTNPDAPVGPRPRGEPTRRQLCAGTCSWTTAGSPLPRCSPARSA